MFAVALMMTGCTKIKTNKLLGLWSSEPYWESYWGWNTRTIVYNFINSNTVVEYSNVADKYYDDSWPHITTPIPGHSGWYRQGEYDATWTYVFEDNKVILSNGTIFTYMDGKLYKDGGAILSPW